MNRAFQNRCIILCLILVSLLSALSARLVQIQLVDRQRYASSSAKAFHRTERLPAIRGMIVDRNEEPIAKSIPVSSIYVDKNHLLDPKLATRSRHFNRLPPKHPRSPRGVASDILNRHDRARRPPHSRIRAAIEPALAGPLATLVS